MARVELQAVRKNYQHYVAIESLDLTSFNGKFLVLLGPSGCGKTTTLNMIAGLDYPTADRIVFDGREVTSELPHGRNVAMVFQSSLLYTHLTVRKNIETSLRHSGLSAGERAHRIEETAHAGTGPAVR
jgi:ABC-type sugar transport system ATPase subunit